MTVRVLAPLVAALVGVVAGTTTALVTVDASTGEREEPKGIVDPLGLGIPLVRYECTGEGLLVLGHGDTTGSLREAMSGNAALGLSYLETAESCDTNFAPERFETKPAYAVVAGPYSGLEEPCELRMSPEYRGDFVTALRDGNEISVKCVCVLDAAAAPVLTPGMAYDERTAVWVRSLQQMLVDHGKLGKDQVTGIYDSPTEARMREMQDASTVRSEPGVVDKATWDLFQKRTCARYDF